MRPAVVPVVFLLLAGCGRPPVPPVAGPGNTPAADPAVLPAALGERPTCALIDPEKDPRVALLEAQLLADPGAVWVERGNIDAVLKEQKLQALFAPEGVGERVRLGKLLKADLLVLVRPTRDTKEPALEVVVSETAGGLRLAVRSVTQSADAGADAAALAGAVREGVLRGRQPIAGVVAVPPFVTHDLGQDHAHCKAAYARLAEAVALARPGVVAVELAEADALGKELALGGAAALARPLPVYLLGEFRHDGPPAGRTATLDLRAERGGRPVGVPAKRLTVPADQVPAAVRGWADGVLDAAATGPRRPAAPAAEAQLLADRADAFERLGNWAEAAALREAALLLDPARLDTRAAVLRPLARQLDALTARSLDFRVHGRPPDPAVLSEAHAIQRRGLEHIEALLARDDVFSPGVSRLVRGADALFLSAVMSFAAAPGAGTAAEEGEMTAERGAALLRLLARTAPHDYGPDHIYVMTAVAGLRPPEKYAWVEQLVLRTATLPRAQVRTTRYIAAARIPQGTGGDEAGPYAGLLARLDTADSPEVRAAAADLRRQDAARSNAPTLPAAKATGLADLGIRPLALVGEADGRPVGRPAGVLAAGPGVDVVWAPGGVYVMKTKGRLRPVWSEPGATVEGGGYDGRYAWTVVYPPREPPRLLVVDPAAEKTWAATTADGIPGGDPRRPPGRDGYRLKVAPVGPGRACVAGSFGQTWVGVAALDPAAGRVAVRVIHEAREAQAQNDREQLDKTTVDFVPGFAHSLKGRPGPDGRAGSRVLLGRGPPLFGGAVGTPNLDLVDRPLVVDPDRGTVAVLRGFSARGSGIGSYNWVAVADGTAYGARPSGMAGAWELVRMGADDLSWTAVGPARTDPLPAGAVTHVLASAVHGGRFHYALHVAAPDPAVPATLRNRYEYWSAALDGSGAREWVPARSMAAIHGLYTSTHYGLVFAASSGPGAGLFPVPDPDPR